MCCCSGESHQDGTSARMRRRLGILVEGPGRTAAPPPVRGWLWSSRGHPGADRPGAAAPSRQGCAGRRAVRGAGFLPRCWIWPCHNMTTPSGAVRQILYGRDPHLVPTDGGTYLLKVCASREAARSVRAASARSVSGGRPPHCWQPSALGSGSVQPLWLLSRCKAITKIARVIVKPGRFERRKMRRFKLEPTRRKPEPASLRCPRGPLRF